MFLMTMTYDALIAALEEAPQQSDDTQLGSSWLLGFDTETTGVAAGRDAIVSATLVLRDPQRGHEGDAEAEWVINPHRRMNPRASAVNGFTDDYLAEHGMEPTDAINQIARAIAAAQDKNIPLLAYNAPFDVHMLEGDLNRWKLPQVSERQNPAEPSNGMLVVDPLVIDRAVSKRHGKRTLTLTTEYYGVVPTGDFHNATADTVAAVDLIKPMSTLYPQVGHLTLGELMDWQRQAHDAWQASFNQWLESRGRTPLHDQWL